MKIENICQIFGIHYRYSVNSALIRKPQEHLFLPHHLPHKQMHQSFCFQIIWLWIFNVQQP